jgi:hypothetical protein
MPVLKTEAAKAHKCQAPGPLALLATEHRTDATGCHVQPDTDSLAASAATRVKATSNAVKVI